MCIDANTIQYSKQTLTLIFSVWIYIYIYTRIWKDDHHFHRKHTNSVTKKKPGRLQKHVMLLHHIQGVCKFDVILHDNLSTFLFVHMQRPMVPGRCFCCSNSTHLKDDSLLNKKWAPCQTQNVQFTKPWVFCSPLWDCRDKKHVTANNRRRPEKTTRHRFTWRQGEGCIPMTCCIAHGEGRRFTNLWATFNKLQTQQLIRDISMSATCW